MLAKTPKTKPLLPKLRSLPLAVLILAAAGLAFSTQVATAQPNSDSPEKAPPIVLENSDVLLEIAPTFGVISRILDKSSGIALRPAPELADNFHLVLQMPEKKTATIPGRDQRLSGVVRSANGLQLNWNGPLKDTEGKEHNIAVHIEVKASGNALDFTLHVDNRADGKINEASYPIIGGLAAFGAPKEPADGVLWIPTSTPWTKKLASSFGSTSFAYPGQANMSFTCVQSEAAKKSLYFASHDEIARYKTYHFDERGKDDAKDVFASIKHYPCTPPGKAFDGSTVALRVVDGDRYAAGQVYRAWFEKTFGISKPADCWIRRQSFFQMTMFQLPEGNINLRYKDIPQWGKEAKDCGLDAVQISGWHVGGHDNGYPYYIIDPRLGTWQELEDGIKACHAMGLKVFFFVNYQQVMLDSDWYKRELVKYREFGPNGEITWNTGWGMGTLWARMGHPKLMTGVDPAFPEYRKIIVDQFAKLAQIGADGVHVDKMFPPALDYNPDLPLGPDIGPWEGVVLLTEEIMTACRKHNPEWAMSFECNWDRMLQFSGAGWWVGNQLVTRSVFPEHVETLVISSPYDFLGINNAVRDGHVVMLAPMYFCQSVGWKPWEGFVAYIKEVKRIRDSLTETVFLGEVRGHEGVQMPSAPASGVAYNVFRNITTSKRVCILTNAGLHPTKLEIAGFEASHGSEVRIHIPFQEIKLVKLPAAIDIPAERIVFVEEL